MKRVFAALGVLLLVGCHRAPTEPTVLSPTSGRLWVMVVTEGGACIQGGAVTIATGVSAGTGQVQEVPCDAWAYSGGILFKDLVANVQITLRASAPGYVTRDVSATPTNSPQYSVFTIALARPQ